MLLALTQGASREDSYKMVQRNAMDVWAGNGNYLDLLKADKDAAVYLTDKELEDLFDLAQHLNMLIRFLIVYSHNGKRKDR